MKEMTLSFNINCMPYLDSNIRSKIFYPSVASEILSFTRITTNLINLVIGVNNLFIRMEKQCSECPHITLLLKKIVVCRYC